MKTAIAALGELWCRAAHDDPSWPVQGHYRCRRCNRVYEIPWEPAGVPPLPETAPPPRLAEAKPISIAA